jgi:hypothetical protein
VFAGDSSTVPIQTKPDARRMIRPATRLLAVAIVAIAMPSLAANESVPDARAEQLRLAKLLENPVANLISVPIQNNWDFGIGPRDALRYTLNVQPVIPFTLSKDWNLITRTIVPYIYQQAPTIFDKDRSGLGDITQSFFLSPSKQVGGLILGAGPVFRYPSATDNALGGERWSAGPTLLVIRQDKSWTYGGLVNHLWSYAGPNDVRNVNATFIQPIVAYNFKTATTIFLSSESLYDWEARQWTVPIQAGVAQMLKFGKQPVRLALAARSYVQRPAGGPDWGMRFQITFPFPK